MITHFDRFSISMTKEQALSASHPGPCDKEVEYLLALPHIDKQLSKIGSAPIRAELAEFGAWDEEELKDDKENRARIIWIAASNIREGE